MGGGGNWGRGNGGRGEWGRGNGGRGEWGEGGREGGSIVVGQSISKTTVPANLKVLQLDKLMRRNKVNKLMECAHSSHKLIGDPAVKPTVRERELSHIGRGGVLQTFCRSWHAQSGASMQSIIV
jgi:hypothetical protein